EALLPAASNWRSAISTPAYRYKLSQLVSAQRVMVRVNSPESRDRFARLQTELSQLEADGGATPRPAAGTILDRVRRNLPAGSALLSFRLGERSSWMWSVYEGKLQLYKLPPKPVIMPEIAAFQDAIASNDMLRIAKVGRRLYEHLFGNRRRGFQA